MKYQIACCTFHYLLLWVHKSIGLILIFTAVAKFEVILNNSILLQIITPIFNLSLYSLLLIAAQIEFALGTLFLSSYPSILSGTVLGTFTLILIVYRTVLLITKWHLPCGCFGNITRIIGISNRTVDLISWIIIGLFSGYSLFLTYSHIKSKLSLKR